MATRLTDLEIQNFLGERKDLPPDYLQRLRTKPKSGHEEREEEAVDCLFDDANLKAPEGQQGKLFRRSDLSKERSYVH
jgi:hypothetical protein